jgi:hypothetical protein
MENQAFNAVPIRSICEEYAMGIGGGMETFKIQSHAIVLHPYHKAIADQVDLAIKGNCPFRVFG